MALSPGSLIKGLTSRILPAPVFDGNENEGYVRTKRYRDVGVESVWPTDHVQADEGSSLVATTLPGATALQLGISAAWAATAAAFLVFNSDSAPGSGNGQGKNIALKRLRLNVSTIPTSGTAVRMSVWLDSANRTPTTVSNAVGTNPGQGPGTPATATAYRAPVVNPNGGINSQTVGVPYFPLSTAAGAPPAIGAAGLTARCIVGQQYLCPRTPIANDEYIAQFGMADVPGALVASATVSRIVTPCPPVIIPPQSWGIIYLWCPANITAGIAFDDASLEWTER